MGKQRRQGQKAKGIIFSHCPCGRHIIYAACCGRFHAGAIAPDAEALMRSRYTAYTLNNEAYLLTTWHASTRPESLNLAAHPTQWLRLDVKQHLSSGNLASVEFIARYRVNGRVVRLHEVSRFVYEEGCWYYVDGVID